MAMPTCESMGNSFFWYEESSSALRWMGRARRQGQLVAARPRGKGVYIAEERNAMWERRTLIATRTACVLLAIPTTTEPCFTASAAYSTWNILPCGELWHEGIWISWGTGLTGVAARAHGTYNVTESLS